MNASLSEGNLVAAPRMRPPIVVAGAVAVAAIVAAYADSMWCSSVALAAVSIFCAIVAYRRVGFLGVTPGIALFYAVTMAVAPAMQYASGAFSERDSAFMCAAQWWTVAGMVSFLVGTMLATRTHDRVSPPPLGGMFVALSNFGLVGLLAMLGIAAAAYSFTSGYFGAGIVASERGALAGEATVIVTLLPLMEVVSWAHAFETRRASWWTVAVLLTTVDVAFHSVTRSKGAVLAPIMLVFLVDLYLRKRPRLVLLLGVTLAYVFVVYPVVTTWRRLGAIEYGDRTELLVEGIGVVVEGQWKDATLSADASASLGRGLLPLFGEVIRRHRIEPLEMGGTYVEGLLRLVPRFAWPEKPEGAIGNRIGRKYDVIAPDDDVTGIALSQVAEMYMNFGGVGVLLGMLATGLLAGWIDGPLVRRLGWCFLYWIWMPVVLGQESVFGQSLLPLGVTVLVVWFIVWVSGMAMDRMQRGWTLAFRGEH